MNMLLIFKGEHETFDEKKVVRDLSEIRGVYNLHQGDFSGSIWECEYDYKKDSTIVRLSDDLKTITVHGIGDASLNIALELQKREPHKLRVVDMGYNFDLMLNEIKSLEDFRGKIRDAELQAA
jgi:hypothetical protein